ncbi:MAG TPA: hypothetical protein VLL54_14170 [Pyrinomonadaceae bacterium]|nr:hypothetical protein [Pyrinomonadaceae bacterium]
MDISSRFSPVDFFAYLFPGIAGTLGLLALLSLTPLKGTFDTLSADLSTGILFLAVSFIMGVVSSGFSEIAIKWREPEARASIKTSIPLDNFQDAIFDAFRDALKLDQEDKIEWSKDHFYLCRSLVFERMQSCGQLIQRQIGLRQLRMNMTFPIVIWFAVGIAWGIHNIANKSLFWGMTLIVVSTSLVIPTFLMIVNRMDSNERREVRETLTAFLVGHKAGMFDKSEKDK